MKSIKVKNEEGNQFLAVVILKGDKYGLNDCLTYDGKKPIVEFYDIEGNISQYVSRYYLSTLNQCIRERCGIQFDFAIPEWSLCFDSLKKAVDFAKKVAGK